MDVYACIMVIAAFVGMLGAVLLLPSAGAAVLFEWGLSRWENKQFSRKRCFTLLILALAVRLLLFFKP